MTNEAIVAPSKAAPAPKPSLRALAIRGSLYTFGGYGFGMGFRLVANTVLAWLLVPEAFGIMTIVNIFLVGLQMFSDVGIGPAIIQSKHGDDPKFLNTAWTIQVVRGVLLWLASLILVWPIAWIYHSYDLIQYVPIAALTAIAAGFNSTALFTLNRDLNMGKLTALNMGTQVLGTFATIGLACVYRNVWALIIGSIIGSILRMIASHVLFPEKSNRFQWDPAAARSLFTFGRWIFLSTVLTFFVNQGDRLILGTYIPTALLGVYGIAYNLATSLSQLVSAVANGVLYPAYSRVERENPAGLRQVYTKSTLALSLGVLPCAGFLLTAGHWIVAFLYDARYQDAGWMLEILALKVAMSGMFPPAGKVLLAKGRPQWALASDVAGIAALFISIPIAFRLWGVQGAVWAIAASELGKLPVFWLGLHKYRLLSIPKELSGLALVAAGALLGWGFAWVFDGITLSRFIHR